MEKSKFPNMEKVIADGGISGFGEWFLKFKEKHPTYDSMNKEYIERQRADDKVRNLTKKPL